MLPCPFGTVVETEAAVENNVLGARESELVARLESLRGKVQLNVKAVYDEEALLRDIVDSEPEVARLRERTRELGDAGYYDRIRLGELVAGAAAGRRAEDEARLLEELGEVAADSVVEEAPEGVALKASFLVDRKGLDRFESRLERTARREQPLLRFEAIGPLPPTAFANAAES